MKREGKGIEESVYSRRRSKVKERRRKGGKRRKEKKSKEEIRKLKEMKGRNEQEGRKCRIRKDERAERRGGKEK